MTVAPVGRPQDGDSGVAYAGGSQATETTGGHPAGDRAVRVTVAEGAAEVAGAVLMDVLGPFAIEEAGMGGGVTLIFYPDTHRGASSQAALTAIDVRAMLPPAITRSGRFAVEVREVARDWVEGWRDHFRPVVVGDVRIRPPWEPPLEGSGSTSPGGAGVGVKGPRRRLPVDVVINPGLGFGTGLHPTTRGTLQLLQPAGPRVHPNGRLVDAGTGSGILAIAAAKLGWCPVVAFDNDPVALTSARENVLANAVEQIVEVHEVDVAGAHAEWFAGATVLANMTLDPVLTLLGRVAAAATALNGVPGADRPASAGPGAARPLRLVVSGILAGEQECELLRVARGFGFSPGRRLYEAGWVSMELSPVPVGGPVGEGPSLLSSPPAGRPAVPGDV